MTLGHKIIGNGDTKVIVLHDRSVATEGDYQFATPFFDLCKLTLAFVDLRGYGMSSDITGEYTTDEIASDFEQVAEKLGWARFSLVGHSMTGMAVQKIMSGLKDTVDKVVAAVPVPASGFLLDADTLALFESMVSDDEASKDGMH